MNNNSGAKPGPLQLLARHPSDPPAAAPAAAVDAGVRAHPRVHTIMAWKSYVSLITIIAVSRGRSLLRPYLLLLVLLIIGSPRVCQLWQFAPVWQLLRFALCSRILRKKSQRGALPAF